ncbi:MAG: hypothetical protein HOV73_01825 [Streptomyces sp.]|nr:hypothetical protein [Streptomyces sp.]
MADKYGIPQGGDPYPGKVKYLGNNKRRLTVKEIYAVCKETWPQGKAELATAVCLAESGGSPFIYNTYKQGHFGLFQISRSAWPEFFAGGSDAWADPKQNSAKAVEIYKKQGWGAWQGYTDGGWKKYQEDVAGVALRWDGKPMKGLLDDIQTLGLGTVLGNAYDAASDAASTVADKTASGLDALGDVWEAITTPALWMRIGYGVLGIGLVAGGLFLVVSNSSAGRGAASAAASVTPIGRAAKKVGAA